MANFPRKLKPNYAKNSTRKVVKLVATKDTIEKMVMIIRKAKKLREESAEYQNGNLSL